ncbi:unnamed protein product [Brachionus calyciflorus]|uniref:Telomerase reverse transcriptase n=1 Tax=Brachionus calyciflorus TaxID=104777 RepID=A0A813UEL6_9BILA|nr:unnamed protein product [Brachionus calyciflorus]
MKNILLSYFDTVLTLEAFFLEINLKLDQKENEQLKRILRNLSSIVIAFDFNFKGPFKSIIDKKFTYEQFLYLSFVKINESNLLIHQNHMLKAGLYSNTGVLVKNFNSFINLPANEIEKKLSSSENLTLCYFLNRNLSNDGIYWRQLYDIVGMHIMKYILMYSFIFRKIDHPKSFNTYVQISGTKFTYIFKYLVAKKLQIDEAKLEEISKAKNEKVEKAQTEVMKDLKPAKPKILKEIFQEQDQIQLDRHANTSSILSQLQKLGNQSLNKTSMLYDRNLGSKIPNRFIYSDKKNSNNYDEAAGRIINNFILKNLILSDENQKENLEKMQNSMKILISNFIKRHQSCPYKIFLDCYCKKDNSNNGIKKSLKRNRNDELKEQENNSLDSKIDPKNVYCFIRRCLMYTLDTEGKKSKRSDTTFQLLGGTDNFENLIKKFRPILSGLKFDSYKLNSLIQDIKISRVNYLKSIECDRFKHLIFLHLIRWLFEDYIFMIVKAYFYVTDTSKTNSEIFYYLKVDWKKIVKSQLSDPVSKNYRKMYNLEKIKQSELIGYCNRFENFGAHMGRLYPKNVNNECRIISGCRAYNPCTNRSLNINNKFMVLNNFLKWIISRNPELIGFGTRGHIDMHNKYSKFLKLNYLNRGTSDQLNEEQDIFKKWNFLKFDINKCFDSIKTKELEIYINQLILKELGTDFCFTSLRYAMFQFDLDFKQLKQKYDSLLVKHNIREKAFQHGLADYINLIENDTQNKFTCFKLKNLNDKGGCIYVPLWVQDRNFNYKKLNDILKKCLNHVVIKIHDDLYERVNGILQGSVCSRNLCDLYLGQIERKLFTFEEDLFQFGNSSLMKLNKSNEIIMRIVDDYLVIGSNVERMIIIKDLLKRELNLNENKTVLYTYQKPCLFGGSNSIINVSEISSSNEYNFLSNFSGVYFSWCGFNFDVNNLDVYFNYEKYFDDSNSLSSRLNSNIDYKYAFIMFNLKFLRLFSSNASIMVIDADTNSLQGIIRNFVDFFSLSSIRFCVLSKLMPSQMITNTKLQIKLILNLCYWLNNKISTKLKVSIEKYFYSSFSLFKFLCLRCYVLIFTRFNIKKFNGLIKLLNVHLKKLNFIRCIKSDGEIYLFQLSQLIQQQIVKFYSCKF